MVVGRAEGVLCNKPALWKDGEIAHSLPSVIGLAGKDGKDGGIGVVVRDRAHRVELAQIVLVGVVVSVPGHHVEWGVVNGELEELPNVLVHNLVLASLVFEPGNGSLKVSGVG